MLTIDSPEILEFLQLWPAPGGRSVRAKQRRAYIAIDCDNGPDSWSGAFLVDRLTHDVFKTKGYGVKGWRIGTIESLISDYRNQRRIHGHTF